MLMRCLLTFFLFLLAVLTPAHGQTAEKPSVMFKNYKHDFGKISASNPVRKVVFQYRNDGKQPVVILDKRVSCGCVTVDYPKDSVMPGKWGKITVTYNGKNYPPGYFKKTILLTTTGTPQYYQLFVSGELIK